MAYGGFKDLPRITASNKVLHNKGFKIAKNAKYNGHQRGLASMVYNFFDKKASSANTLVGGIKIRICQTKN